MSFRTKFLSTRMMAKIRHLFLLLFVLATVLPTAAIPPKPSPQRLVNDFAGLFTAGQVDELERKLVAFDDSTSNQITVVTVNDLEGRAAAEYADRIGIEWGVGSKAYNNGIVVLVKPKTSDSGGQVTIQVGYGLEGAIPDIYASRIIRNDMIPHFQENDYYGGVVQACENLMALASGEISEPRSRDDDDDPFESLLAMLVIDYADGTSLYDSYWASIWAIAYPRHLITRPSCHNCPFCCGERVGDISIGDFWGVERTMPQCYSTEGVSLVLVSTESGRLLWEAVQADMFADESSLAVAMQPVLMHHSSPDVRREAFWADYHRGGFDAVVRKYWHYTPLLAVRQRVKLLLHIGRRKTGKGVERQQ